MMQWTRFSRGMWSVKRDSPPAWKQWRDIALNFLITTFAVSIILSGVGALIIVLVMGWRGY